MHVGTIDVKQLWNRLCIGPTADINYVSKVMNYNSQTNKYWIFQGYRCSQKFKPWSSSSDIMLFSQQSGHVFFRHTIGINETYHISCKLLYSSKYFVQEVSPLWTCISHQRISWLRWSFKKNTQFFKEEEKEHPKDLSIQYLKT